MKPNLSKQIISGAVVMSFLTLPAQYLYAEGPWGHKGKEDHAQWEEKKAEVFKQLGLTAEQEAKSKEHKEKHHGEMKAMKEQIRDKKEQMKQELQKADFDVNKVKQINEELKTLMVQIEDHHLEGILEVRQILTPEQFSKFMELKESWKNKKGEDGPRGDMDK